MTEEQIEKLDAGRELDRLIAERVFKRDRWNARQGARADGDLEYHWGYPLGHDIAPHYSTDIAAAWQVLDQLSQVILTQKIGAWECQCFDGIGGVSVRAETAPLAICRVALIAAKSPVHHGPSEEAERFDGRDPNDLSWR